MSNDKIRKKFKIQSPKFRELRAVFGLWNSDFFRHWEFVIRHFPSFSHFPTCSPASTSFTSSASNAIDRRMKYHEMNHTSGKNSTPSRNHVRVKPKTRVAINSGKK